MNARKYLSFIQLYMPTSGQAPLRWTLHGHHQPL